MQLAFSSAKMRSTNALTNYGEFHTIWNSTHDRNGHRIVSSSTNLELLVVPEGAEYS